MSRTSNGLIAPPHATLCNDDDTGAAAAAGGDSSTRGDAACAAAATGHVIGVVAACAVTRATAGVVLVRASLRCGGVIGVVPAAAVLLLLNCGVV